MNKFVRNNRVAVLIDPTKGWYTRHGDLSKAFDPNLVELVLTKSPQAPDGLQVEWLVPGDRFVIEHWQGQEVIRVLVPDLYIEFSGPDNWLTA